MASQKSTAKRAAEKRVKYKKNPDAPRRFKSAYMFYSERKHKELRQRDECKRMRTADVAKLVSRAWKDLASCDRLVYLDMAKKDKERYEIEKANYKGPWKVINQRTTGQDKKPASASPVLDTGKNLQNSAIHAIQGAAGHEMPKISDFWNGDFASEVSTRGRSDTRVHLSDDIDDRSLGSLVSNLDALENQIISEWQEVSRGQQKNSGLVTPGPLPTQTSGSKLDNFIELQSPIRLDGPYPLTPLISTDFGSYLAAAALFDSMSESIFD